MLVEQCTKALCHYLFVCWVDGGHSFDCIVPRLYHQARLDGNNLPYIGLSEESFKFLEEYDSGSFHVVIFDEKRQGVITKRWAQ